MVWLLKLPTDIRQIIYDLIVQTEKLTHCNTNSPPSYPGQSVSTVIGEQRATNDCLNAFLVNKQLYRELLAVWCRAHRFKFTAYDTGVFPKMTLVDTERERSIVANARSYKIEGHVGGWAESVPHYSVKIDVHRCRDLGYRPVWFHLTSELKRWFGVSDVQYQSMVNRVKAAVSTAIASCAEGLTWEGVSGIIDAFHLCDLLDDGEGSDDKPSHENDEDDGDWRGADGEDPCGKPSESLWAGGRGDE
ncbi:hypothetical protein LTR17_007987 [Elasticomyces elasticus]|nr:hypothetical protein LTR17_007987 [Elasticomyces elasticus]